MPEEPVSTSKPDAFRVLIIDDSRAIRMVIRNLMRDFGFETEEAPDGAEALRFFTSGKTVNLIICDWEMPVLSGVDFVRQYRGSNLALSRDTPILMSTSVTAVERIEEALVAGANDYLMKPFSKEMFASKLDLLGIDHK